MLRSFNFTNAIWQQVEAQCLAAGGRETGFLLLGVRAMSEADGEVQVDLVALAAIGEGPCAEASAAHFAADTAYQQSQLDQVFAARPGWVFLAEGHLHPPGLSVPSDHDIQMAAQMARDPGYGVPNATMPIVIATITRGRLALRAFAVNGGDEPPKVHEILVLLNGEMPPEPPASERSQRRSIIGSIIRRYVP